MKKPLAMKSLVLAAILTVVCMVGISYSADSGSAIEILSGTPVTPYDQRYEFSEWKMTVRNNGTEPVDHVQLRLNILYKNDNSLLYSQVHTINMHLDPQDVLSSPTFPLKQKIEAGIGQIKWNAKIIKVWDKNGLVIEGNEPGVNAKDNTGETIDGNKLAYIIGYEGKAAVEALIAKGLDVNASVKFGGLPLAMAVSQEKKDIVELLIAKGANVNAKENDGRTPLHLAAHGGNTGIATLLIDNGAVINAKDKYGNTSLHYAVRNNKKEMLELLVAKGADINAKDKDGYTPLGWAVMFGKKDMAELLKKYGARE